MFGYVVSMTINIKYKSIKNNTIFLSNNLTCVNVWLFRVSYLKAAWKTKRAIYDNPAFKKL